MKYISINSHTIRKNAKRGTTEPPIRVAKSPSDKHPVYASEVELVGAVRLVYDPERAIMKCGARLVIECTDVRIVK